MCICNWVQGHPDNKKYLCKFFIVMDRGEEVTGLEKSLTPTITLKKYKIIK